MGIDSKVKRSGNWSKLVDWSKIWKYVQLFDRSPIFKSNKFIQLNYSQLYNINNTDPKNSDRFQVNQNYP